MDTDGQHEIDLVDGCFIDHAATIAAEGYENVVAPSIDELNYYALVAGELFLGYFIDNTLVGYICGIRVHGNDLNMNSSVHLPEGDALLIKSICTETDFRHLGIASCLLRAFLEHSFECSSKVSLWHGASEHVSRVLVHSPAILIPLFTRSGFSMRYRAWYKQGRVPHYECEFYYSPERRIVRQAGRTITWRKRKYIKSR